MQKVFIAQTAAVTPLGESVETLFDGLMAGRMGIGKVKHFDTTGLAGSCAGIIRDLDGLKEKPRVLHLADMLLDRLGPMAADTRLIVASTKAGIEEIENDSAEPGRVNEKPLLSDLTGYISRKLNLKGAGININAACASSTIAIAKGAALIRSGAADAVLICCMDVVSRFVFTGFSALGAMSDKPARPFDVRRNGLNLGEGAAAVLLTSENKAAELGKKPAAQLSGWGIAADADHLTAPAKDGSGLKKAVLAACRMANTEPMDVHAVNTHGTGTVYNDAMELVVLNSLFDPGKLVANSIKGAIGHTLGAAGGIETALCVYMLEKGTMVPTKGLESPEKKGAGIILKKPGELTGDKILTMNSGFGGINAALLVERMEPDDF